jgi:hypothetical protein
LSRKARTLGYPLRTQNRLMASALLNPNQRDRRRGEKEDQLGDDREESIADLG